MAEKYLDINGLSRLWNKISNKFLPLAGGTLTGALTILNNDGSASIQLGQNDTALGIYSSQLNDWIIKTNETSVFIPKWANKGSATKPVYFDNNGHPQVCGDSLAVDITGHAASAGQLNYNTVTIYGGFSATPILMACENNKVVWSLERTSNAEKSLSAHYYNDEGSWIAGGVLLDNINYTTYVNPASIGARRTFTSVGELGLTAPVTTHEAYSAMPSHSTLIVQSADRNQISDTPTSHMTVIIHKAYSYGYGECTNTNSSELVFYKTNLYPDRTFDGWKAVFLKEGGTLNGNLTIPASNILTVSQINFGSVYLYTDSNNSFMGRTGPATGYNYFNFNGADGQLYLGGHKVYHTNNKPTAADIGALPLSGGTMTGQIKLASNGYRTSSDNGYSVDQYGNFTHLSNSTSDYWMIKASDGNTPAIQVYSETGDVSVKNNLTAFGHIGYYIELNPGSSVGHGGFIDFHYNGSNADYTSRIIEEANETLSVNKYAKVALGTTTMNGPLTLVGSQYSYYTDATKYALNCNNSDIIKVNALYMADAADAYSEGIMFYRNGSVWDSLTAKEGVFYFGSAVGAENVTLKGSASIRCGAIRCEDGTNSGKYYVSSTIHATGTTSAHGIGRLTLGNSTAAGTAGNAKGLLTLYSSNDKRVDVYTSSGALSANKTIYLDRMAQCSWDAATGTLTISTP